jgi:hypothetical protein
MAMASSMPGSVSMMSFAGRGMAAPWVKSQCVT